MLCFIPDGVKDISEWLLSFLKSRVDGDSSMWPRYFSQVFYSITREVVIDY